MSDTNTDREGRERIEEITFSLATASRVVTPDEVPAALDAYRDQVLTEAAELIRNAARASYASDVDMLAAADLLLAARTTTAQED